MNRSLALVPLLVCAACAGMRTWPTRWIDLTHPFDEQTLYWPTASPFRLTSVFAGETPQGYYYAANDFSAAEHGGTHLDAPIHFAAGQRTVDEVPLDDLIGPACVVDVSRRALADRDYEVGVLDLLVFEDEHGKIRPGSIVLVHTGYGRFWPEPLRYLGTTERGPAAVARLHFPGLHPDAARWLVAERAVKAVGIDTPSIDFGQSKRFESHRALFAANVPVFENVANLEQLPAQGARVVALPMLIRGGSGSPLRIAAGL